MLALQQPPRIRLQLGRPLGHTLFQLAIQLLELLGLAVKLNKDLDLGTQQIGDDRDWHIVHCSHLVAAHQVNISKVNSGDENDRGSLAARVFANHGGKLESVEIRHADIQENHRDFSLEQVLKSVRGR